MLIDIHIEIKELHMPNPTDYDLLVSIGKKLDTLITAGIKVDLTPVLTALTGVQNSVNAVISDLAPTPDQIPSVTAISPTSGSINGGETVTLTGTNFTGATGVMFGTVAGTNLAVQSDTSITVTAPAQAADVVDVTVVDAAGTSVVNAADKYLYA